MTDKAIKLFEESRKLFPTNPSSVFYLAVLYSQTKRIPELKKLIKSSKEQYSGNRVFEQHMKNLEAKLKNTLSA